ncbi:SdpI family protein [Roseivirga pacifica]|uniref:SdpI family protein n=1 Tax=Roseivirga pacifica TaxID=1267423 RepID=UPI00209536D5|nr:SdpI family protein [Roseivirga pacifica]MCO6357506.1 hypothetical protein [Roseivirga pacifica]MCO6367729.1 hypothetical protein [Roseivirga pacifica]MCO6369739.1 hypothetical protein [Roseivirga pacifica]MCO6373593.1 hypothetical protein [Roseivirga pacifica]MCO6377102.1 hypothetical protein [Roseivirga pacifica]
MNTGMLIGVHVMFAFSSILPAVLMRLVDTEEPNKLLGYRTKWSFKSKETWAFANKYSAKLMAYSTIVSLTFQVFAFFMLPNETGILLMAGVLTLGITVVLAATEIQLRKRFNKDGSPKSGFDPID